MPFSTYSHRSIQVNAMQFGGTIQDLLTIFNSLTPDPSGVQVTTNFDSAGQVSSVAFNGAHQLAFNPGDWIVVPADGGPVFVVDQPTFQRDWQ